MSKRVIKVFVQQMGILPLEAITCGTRNSAIATPEHGETGVVAVGMRADLLVVDGDPAEDIAMLQDRSRLRHLMTSVPLTQSVARS